MEVENLADLGTLIEKHRHELLSASQREVALLPGAEQLDGPTITDNIPQLLTELSNNLKSEPNDAALIQSSSEHGVQRCCGQ